MGHFEPSWHHSLSCLGEANTSHSFHGVFLAGTVPDAVTNHLQELGILNLDPKVCVEGYGKHENLKHYAPFLKSNKGYLCAGSLTRTVDSCSVIWIGLLLYMLLPYIEMFCHNSRYRVKTILVKLRRVHAGPGMNELSDFSPRPTKYHTIFWVVVTQFPKSSEHPISSILCPNLGGSLWPAGEYWNAPSLTRQWLLATDVSGWCTAVAHTYLYRACWLPCTTQLSTTPTMLWSKPLVIVNCSNAWHSDKFRWRRYQYLTCPGFYHVTT